MGSIFSSIFSHHQETDSHVVVIHTKENWLSHWQTYKDSNKLMVIDFSASWCGPCRFIEPAVKSMAAKFSDVVFAKIDVDELKEVAEEWKIEAMPTFVLVKSGKEIDRVVGANKAELQDKVQKLRK